MAVNDSYGSSQVLEGFDVMFDESLEDEQVSFQYYLEFNGVIRFLDLPVAIGYLIRNSSDTFCCGWGGGWDPVKLLTL